MKKKRTTIILVILSGGKRSCTNSLCEKYQLSDCTIQRWKEAFEKFVLDFLKNNVQCRLEVLKAVVTYGQYALLREPLSAECWELWSEVFYGGGDTVAVSLPVEKLKQSLAFPIVSIKITRNDMVPSVRG